MSSRFPYSPESDTTKYSVAVIIINEEGEILLVCEDGKWGPPAGHVEDGEELVYAGIREVFEETGVDVRSTLASDTFPFAPFVSAGQFRSSTSWGFVLRGEVASFSDFNPSDPTISSVGWYSRSQIRKLYEQGLIRKSEVNYPILMGKEITEEEVVLLKLRQDELKMEVFVN